MSNFENPYKKRILTQKDNVEIPDKIIKVVESCIDKVDIKLSQYEYKKNEELFNELIDRFNDGYKKLIEGSGIEPFKLSIDNIHIIETSKMPNILNAHNYWAFISNGHIYLRNNRCDDTNNLIMTLSHELMHYISKNEIIAHIFQEKSKYDVEVKKIQIGLKQINNRGGIYGNGFNEAMTEFLAMKLRQNMDFKSFVDYRDLNLIKNSITSKIYDLLIKVINNIFKKYADIDILEDNNVLKKILRLYITGDSELLKELNVGFRKHGKPDGLRILYSMDETIESVQEVAKKLEIEL